MGQRLVIALGGNALGNTPAEQLELIKETARTIVDLVELGNDVIVTHGNGPQVGMIKVRRATLVTISSRRLIMNLPFVLSTVTALQS